MKKLLLNPGSLLDCGIIPFEPAIWNEAWFSQSQKSLIIYDFKLLIDNYCSKITLID